MLKGGLVWLLTLVLDLDQEVIDTDRQCVNDDDDDGDGDGDDDDDDNDDDENGNDDDDVDDDDGLRWRSVETVTKGRLWCMSAAQLIIRLLSQKEKENNCVVLIFYKEKL